MPLLCACMYTCSLASCLRRLQAQIRLMKPALTLWQACQRSVSERALCWACTTGAFQQYDAYS